MYNTQFQKLIKLSHIYKSQSECNNNLRDKQTDVNTRLAISVIILYKLFYNYMSIKKIKGNQVLELSSLYIVQNEIDSPVCSLRRFKLLIFNAIFQIEWFRKKVLCVYQGCCGSRFSHIRGCGFSKTHIPECGCGCLKSYINILSK